MFLALTFKQWFFVWLLILLLGLFLYNGRKKFCFIHFRIKDLKAYQPFDTTMYCSQCVLHEQEKLNPKVKCKCGWKGRLVECETTYDLTTEVGQDWTNYHCPNCTLKIIH